jgi:hypothetical protein
MPSLLVIIFAVELAVQLINNLGAATINSLVSNAGTTDTAQPETNYHVL